MTLDEVMRVEISSTKRRVTKYDVDAGTGKLVNSEKM
jgi:hypothetical protein